MANAVMGGIIQRTGLRQPEDIIGADQRVWKNQNQDKVGWAIKI